MDIHVDGKKAIIKATTGDIVYFDDCYWLIGTGLVPSGATFKLHFYLTPLPSVRNADDTKSVIEIADVSSYEDLQAWLSEQQAVIYDGKEAKIYLTYKQPE